LRWESQKKNPDEANTAEVRGGGRKEEGKEEVSLGGKEKGKGRARGREKC